MIFPAPEASELAMRPGASRHAVRLADGAELPAIYWPAPEGAPTLVEMAARGRGARRVLLSPFTSLR